MNDRERIAERLKMLLTENKISAAKLEEEMALGFGTIRHYLKLKYTPRLSILVEIAERFDVSVDWILGRSATEHRKVKFCDWCGNRVKQLQVENEMKPKDIAKITGLTVSAVRALYREDVKYPSLQVVNRLSDYFNVSVDWILGITKQEDRK